MMTESCSESMSEVSSAVLRALQTSTTLAKPILKTQCELLGYEPHALELSHLDVLGPRLLEAVSRFGTPAKVRTLRAALLATKALGPTQALGAVKEPPSGCRRVVAPARVLSTQFAERVREILEARSPLGWSLLEAQCQRRGVRPSNLSPDELTTLLPDFERSLRRFDAPATIEVVRLELKRLLHQWVA